MNYIVYENFNGNINLVTDPETGDTLILESLEAATETANDCQSGFAVPLNTNIVDLASENCEFISSTFGCPEGDDYELYNLNAEICDKKILTEDENDEEVE